MAILRAGAEPQRDIHMARSWYGSKWLRFGGAILLLGLVALAIPFLIPVDRFRPMLERLVEASTGREVEIDAVRLHLVPTIRLRAVNIRVKQPDGFGAGHALTVKSVDFKVAPAALLARRLDVTDIIISGVRVNVLRDPAGRTNFEPSAPRPIAPPVGTGSIAGPAPFISLERVGAVTVKNVEITVANSDLRRGQVTRSLTLSGLNATIRSFDPNAPNWPRKLEIAADLRGAMLTTPLLPKPVQFQTGELLVKGGVARGTFSAAMGIIRAEGTAAIASLDPLSVTFAVAIPVLDVDRLEGLAIRSTISGADPARQRLVARGDVKIRRLVLSPLEATRMSGRLSVYTRTIQLDSYGLSAYGGTIEGTAALDYSAANLPTTMVAKVRRLSLARLSAVYPAARKFTGALDVDLRLAAAVRRDLAATLRGAGTFAVRNGSFQGFDVRSNLAKSAGVLQPDVPGGATRFSYFGGDLRIAQRRVHSVSLRLEAEGLQGVAGGSFGINKTLDYAGTGVLKNPTSEKSRAGGASRSIGRRLGDLLRAAAVSLGVRVPFSLRGTFADPQFSFARTPQPIPDQGLRQQRQQQRQEPKQPSSQDLR